MNRIYDTIGGKLLPYPFCISTFVITMYGRLLPHVKVYYRVRVRYYILWLPLTFRFDCTYYIIAEAM